MELITNKPYLLFIIAGDFNYKNNPIKGLIPLNEYKLNKPLITF